MKALKGRKTKYPVISGVVEVEVSWLPISPALPLTSLRAVLTVFLYSANNLGHYVSSGGGPAVPLPLGYLPSPRVSQRVDKLIQCVNIRRLLNLATWNYGEVQ